MNFYAPEGIEFWTFEKKKQKKNMLLSVILEWKSKYCGVIE